jgi:hypothetical protein
MSTMWWSDLPARARRLSPALFGALSDGAYLTAWPAVAAWVPPLVLVLGLYLGAHRPESWVVPTSSLAMMAILVTVGGFSAALGTYLSVGYAIGDFVWRSHPAPAGHTAYGLYALTHVRAPLLIAYVVMAGLAMLVPLGSRQLSASAALGIRPGTPNAGAIRDAAHAALVSLFTAAWLISAPTLLRPLFTWQGVAPPPAIIPSRYVEWMVALLATGVALARNHLESMAITRVGYVQFQADTRRGEPTPTRSSRPPLPVEASLFLGAALGTFLLSGLLHSPEDALLLGSVLTLVGVLRGLMPHAASWNALVSRVPLVPRLIVSVILGGIVARIIIGALWQQLPVSLSMACAIGGALSVAAVLMGGRGLGTASPAPVPAAPDRRLAAAGSAPNGKLDAARIAGVLPSSSPVSVPLVQAVKNA